MTAKVFGSPRSFGNSAALAPYLRVKIDGGVLAAAGEFDDEVGVLEQRTQSTDVKGPVRLPSSGETVRVTAAGAITQFAPIFKAAGGKVSATDNGRRWGLALEAASGDGSVIEALRIAEPAWSGLHAEEVEFVEDGAGTYTASVPLPPGATLVDVIVHATAVWAAASSATMKVGDADDDDGFFAGVNVKATDLLAGESINFSHTGGKDGDDVDSTDGAGAHVRRRYLATAREVIGVITSVGAGTTGRTRMTVIYSAPSSTKVAVKS